MYIIPEYFEKLPSSVLINHENTNYRIFMTDDQLTYFVCHLKNHTSSRWPLNKNTTNIASTVNSNDKNDTTKINQITQINNTPDKPYYVEDAHTDNNVSDEIICNNDTTITKQIAQISNIEVNTQQSQECDKIISPDNINESLKRKANSSVHVSESHSSREITNDTTPFEI